MLVLFQLLVLKKYQTILIQCIFFFPSQKGNNLQKETNRRKDPDVIHLPKDWMIKQLITFFYSESMSKALGRYSEHSFKRTETIAKFKVGGERNLNRSIPFSVLLLPQKTRHSTICYNAPWNLTSRRFYCDCITSIM